MSRKISVAVMVLAYVGEEGACARWFVGAARLALRLCLRLLACCCRFDFDFI